MKSCFIVWFYLENYAFYLKFSHFFFFFFFPPFLLSGLQMGLLRFLRFLRMFSLLEHLGGSVGQTSDSWFQFSSSFQGSGMEPYIPKPTWAPCSVTILLLTPSPSSPPVAHTWGCTVSLPVSLCFKYIILKQTKKKTKTKKMLFLSIASSLHFLQCIGVLASHFPETSLLTIFY